MNKTKPFLAVVGISLALTLTFSCSSDDGGDNTGGGGDHFNPNITYGSFTDSRDQKIYRTVVIGTQTWLAENLNYEAAGSVCYDNKTDNCAKYGRLYDWETANTACPSGWHLPSDDEWDELMSAVGGASTAGTNLKANGGWHSNGNGTDDYGFSALPGGSRPLGGSFQLCRSYGFWWGSSEFGIYRRMNYDDEFVDMLSDNKSDLLSVRCIKNAGTGGGDGGDGGGDNLGCKYYGGLFCMEFTRYNNVLNVYEDCTEEGEGEFFEGSCPSGYIIKCDDEEYYGPAYFYDSKFQGLTCQQIWDMLGQN